MTEDLHRIATHEAGHAVVAELLCMNPEYVTIEPGEATLGHLRRRRYCVSPLDTWRDLIFLCGGHIAEIIEIDDEMSDEHWGAEMALSMLDPDATITDGAYLWASLREHSDDERQQKKWFKQAFAQTHRILSNRAVWRSVENLAARLTEKRTINYAEAAEVIDAALGRSKWNREQFRMGERYASPPQTWIDSREEYREIAEAMAATKGAK